jgi:hypothetical protein
MATYIFQKISQEGKAEGILPGSIDARDWFRDRAGDVRNVNVQNEIRNKERLYPKLVDLDVGRMYMFFYDPKHKETLPYYDRFPLIFVMEKYKDGFLGMNLHYLPPVYRARLMDNLYSIERNDAQRESKKLRMSYGLLNSVARYKYFRPTVKRYLSNHVRSRFLYIPYEEWDIALMLPTERFKKSKKQTVWKDSKQNIRKRR